MTIVVVSERGHTDVSAEIWARLESSPNFWHLVHSQVLSASPRSNGKATIHGTSLVGRAVCEDGLIIECREKITGALTSLISYGIDSLKLRPIDAPATDIGQLISIIVQAFVDGVREYVGIGREWRYASVRSTSSLVGGRLHIPSTVRLRARGLRHLVSFDRYSIDRSTEANQLIYAGLREVELLATLVELGPGCLTTSRAMSMFFEDCRTPAVLFGSSLELANNARRISEQRGDAGLVSRLLDLSALLLAHQSFEAVDPSLGQVPFSWFVNLETLFERAVREGLRRAVPDGVRVVSGAGLGRSVFTDTGYLNASPDIVLSDRGETLVGDVKYKDWTASAAASDLYQLLVHSKVFGATNAFLVYPSHSHEAVHVGRAATGADVWLFSVNIEDLDASIRDLVISISRRPSVPRADLYFQSSRSESVEVHIGHGDRRLEEQDRLRIGVAELLRYATGEVAETRTAARTLLGSLTMNDLDPDDLRMIEALLSDPS